MFKSSLVIVIITLPILLLVGCRAAAPTATPTPTPTSASSPMPTLASTPLDIISVTSPVLWGDEATVQARTIAGAYCTITVHYASGPSQAAGLSPKNADSSGNVSWTWRVSSNTTPGNWRIVVTAEKDGKRSSVETYFTVSGRTPTPASTPTPTSAPTPTPSAQSVAISGFAFSPPTVTIARGTTVTWTNQDSTPHTVTSDNAVFDSGNMNRGATYSYTFNQSGTFSYHCEYHPSMRGSVVVQ